MFFFTTSQKSEQLSVLITSLKNTKHGVLSDHHSKENQTTQSYSDHQPKEPATPTCVLSDQPTYADTVSMTLEEASRMFFTRLPALPLMELKRADAVLAAPPGGTVAGLLLLAAG